MVEYDKKFWMGWSDAYIEDVESEVPENFTPEHREKIALWLYKMAREQHENWKRAEPSEKRILDEEDTSFLSDIATELRKIDNNVYEAEATELENIIYRAEGN